MRNVVVKVHSFCITLGGILGGIFGGILGGIFGGLLNRHPALLCEAAFLARLRAHPLLRNAVVGCGRLRPRTPRPRTPTRSS